MQRCEKETCLSLFDCVHGVALGLDRTRALCGFSRANASWCSWNRGFSRFFSSLPWNGERRLPWARCASQSDDLVSSSRNRGGRGSPSLERERVCFVWNKSVLVNVDDMVFLFCSTFSSLSSFRSREVSLV